MPYYARPQRSGVESFLLGYGAMQDIQTNQARNALIQQKIENEQIRRNALQEYGQTGDLNKLMTAAPEIGLKMQENALARVKLGMEARKAQDAQLKTGMELYDKFRPLLSVGGQGAWNQYLGEMSSRGIDVSTFPQQYSPDVLDTMDKAKMGLKDRLGLETPKISTIEQDGEKVTVGVYPGGRMEKLGSSSKYEPKLFADKQGNLSWGIPGKVDLNELQPAEKYTGRTREIHDYVKMIGGDPTDPKQVEDARGKLYGQKDPQVGRWALQQALKDAEKDWRFKTMDPATKQAEIDKLTERYVDKSMEAQEQYLGKKGGKAAAPQGYQVWSNKEGKMVTVTKEQYDQIKQYHQGQK